MTKTKKKLKKKIFKSLLTKVRTEMDTWKKARVREGGNILVMTSGGDKYTGSSEVFKTDDESLSSLKQSNPQIDVLSVPNASHITVLIEPSQALEQIFDMQSKSAI